MGHLQPHAGPHAEKLSSAREAITYFRPMEDREADHAPLSARLIRRRGMRPGPEVRQSLSKGTPRLLGGKTRSERNTRRR